VIVAVLCVHFFALALLASGLVPRGVWHFLHDVSAGKIEPRMAGAGFIVLVTLLVLALGRARVRDLGASWRQLAAGVVFAVVVWSMVQVFVVVWHLVVGEIAGTSWPTSGEMFFFMTAAFSEELVCRGVLLLGLLDTAQRRGWSMRMALATSLGVSSVVFALNHLPLLFAIGASPSAVLIALTGHVLSGLLFGALMLLTRNLWATTLVHALVNMRPGLQGTEVLAPWFDAYAIGAVVLAAGWVLVSRSRPDD
jgi:membrane protease YdiL (CAAX protease family)